ncbi:MAG: hypothetical protein HZB43_05005 [candidate division Zixibacteria bacterium]|nr:hypothetical protein [candidate division Zixibacteria bacterium]
MVQPIELQDVLAKTQAAERITQLQKASPENDQRQSLLIAGQKASEAQHKATPAVHPDEVILHRNPEEEKKRKKEKKGDKAPKEGTDEDADKIPPAMDEEPPLPPPVLDITV